MTRVGSPQGPNPLHPTKQTGAAVPVAKQGKLDQALVEAVLTGQGKLEGGISVENAALPTESASGLTALASFQKLEAGMPQSIRGKAMASEILGNLTTLPEPTGAMGLPAEQAVRVVQLVARAESGEVAVHEEAHAALATFGRMLTFQIDQTAQQQKLKAHMESPQFAFTIGVAKKAFQTATPGKADLDDLSKSFAQLGELDVEQLAQVVMMACAKEHEGDLKDLMKNIKENSLKRKQLREGVLALKTLKEQTETQLRSEYNDRTKLDPLNGLYIDSGHIPFSDFVKGRELALSLGAGDGTGIPTAELTNVLQTFPSTDRDGPAPTVDALDASTPIAAVVSNAGKAARNKDAGAITAVYDAILAAYPARSHFIKYLDWAMNKKVEAGKITAAQAEGLKNTLVQRFDDAVAAKKEEAEKDNGRFKNHAIASAGAKGGTLASIDLAIENLQKNSDSLGDLSQEMQIKLQIAMDRRSKIYETLSTIMKKTADTQKSIIDNMK